jgi:hypothetical protein
VSAGRESARPLERRLEEAILADPWHRQVLQTLRAAIEDGWVAGGFVRNLIWDMTIGPGGISRPDDVDVILMGCGESSARADSRHEQVLRKAMAGVNWSVRDQARMHTRSNDAPYETLKEAVEVFPDTSSAIAVRLNGLDALEIIAPFGLQDAFGGVLRASPRIARDDPRFERLLERKLRTWRSRWPELRVVSPS